MASDEGQKLKRSIGRMALAVGFATALSIPLIYAFTAFNYEAAHLEAEAGHDAEALSRLIFQHQETWAFQEPRIESELTRHIKDGVAISKNVLDSEGRLAAEVGQPVAAPYLTASVPLLLGSEEVGRLEMTQSVLHIYLRTALVSILGLLLGLAMYSALRIYPMRALMRATDDLQRANEELTREISEREETERRLQQAQKMEAVGQLTGGIAHDFNNLLGVVMGNADLLQDEIGETIQTAGILRASQRGAELTQRLLAFSRQQALHPESIDLAALVAGMADMLDRTFGETVTIDVSSESGLWETLADPGQVENALLNLAINAKHAMADGGRLEIAVANTTLARPLALPESDAPPGDYVVLTVKDNGQGIAEKDLEHVFEPFFTTKEVGEGSGLGLSMVYGFAKQSGGFVTLESEVGQGTSVQLYLPRSLQPSTSEVQQSAEQPTKKEGESVLVVEDDPDLRAMAVAMLRDSGYSVQEAADGETAIKLLRRPGRLDVLLSDVVLPRDLNGPDVAELARSNHPKIAVLFMSGYADGAAQRLDHISGAQLISKPFRRADLLTALRSLVDGQRAEFDLQTGP